MASPARQQQEEERLDRVFGALSNRTRRGMLRRLVEGPASVTELAEPYSMSLPAVSQHLDVLEKAGLVRRQRDGRVQRCTLDASPIRDVADFAARYRPFWEDTLAALARHAEGPNPRDEDEA